MVVTVPVSEKEREKNLPLFILGRLKGFLLWWTASVGA